jgi:hypothetical protein
MIPISAFIIGIAIEGPPAHEAVGGYVAGYLGVEGGRCEKGANGEKGDKVAHGSCVQGWVSVQEAEVCVSFESLRASLRQQAV